MILAFISSLHSITGSDLPRTSTYLKDQALGFLFVSGLPKHLPGAHQLITPRLRMAFTGAFLPAGPSHLALDDLSCLFHST